MANSKRHASMASAVPEAGAATVHPSNEAQPHARDPILRHKLLERTGFRDDDFIIYYKTTVFFTFFLLAYMLVTTFENLASKMGQAIFASCKVVTPKNP